MRKTTETLAFSGQVLRRGFWLYVWEIQPPNSERIYYVGRTGDSSSPNAQSPFSRMSHHLGFNRRSNVLRRHLEKRNIAPERVSPHRSRPHLSRGRGRRSSGISRCRCRARKGAGRCDASRRLRCAQHGSLPKTARYSTV